jgi:hypothetical protein
VSEISDGEATDQLGVPKTSSHREGVPEHTKIQISTDTDGSTNTDGGISEMSTLEPEPGLVGAWTGRVGESALHDRAALAVEPAVACLSAHSNIGKCGR